jgi:tetratricopeptide (TPR) repeat protein
MAAKKQEAQGVYLWVDKAGGGRHSPGMARKLCLPGLPDQRWRVAALCLVLAAITFAVFGQTLRHEFLDFDDSDYVYGNDVVARGLTLKGIVWAFTSTHSDNWHPLTWLSHELDCQFYGLNPGGHHLTNVLLHTATVIALFLVLRQMTGALWRSAFVAAVFAIHPLRVESVAWVAERKDVLSGLFFMLTMGAYVRYARRPWSLARYGWVVLLFAMGLMSKPMLVTLPVVLLLLDYWPLQRVEPRKLSGLVLEKLPLLALSAAVCVATLFAQTESIQPFWTFPLPLRLANALAACMIYLGQMFYPAQLAVSYPYPYKGLSGWEVGLAGLLLAGLSAVAWGWRRKQPWLLVGWVWYLVMLLPVIGIIQVGAQAHADRYTYLPQIGIYVALTWLAAEWGGKWQACRVVFGGLMTGVILALMVCAWQQTAYWKNSVTLWTRTVACASGNASANFSLGNALIQKGRVDEAIAHYQNALRILPGYAQVHNNLGNALLQEGKVDEAISHFQRALENKANYAEARYNLGNAFLQKGKVDEAISHLQKALQIRPGFAEAHFNLGNAFLKKGKVDEAISHLQKALQIRPGFAEAHFNLGNAFLKKGRVDDAISEYQINLQIKPDNADAHVNLGTALLQKGKADDAILHFQKALETKPGLAAAHFNLGNALLKKGRVDEGIAHYQKALEIEADNAEAHYNLGTALLQKGKTDEAMVHYQSALRINPDHVDAHVNLGNLLLQTGRVDEAILHFQKALQINPENVKAQNNLGTALLQKGRMDEAISQYQKALQINPDYVEAHVNLGNVLLQTGRLDEAISQYQRALQINPGNVKAQQNLDNALLQKGQAGLPFHSPEQTKIKK